MKIAMINGSPKGKNSASGVLLQDLKSYLTENAEIKEFCFNKPQIDERMMADLYPCDALVFAYPLYVDGIPSHLLSCLRELEKEGINNKNCMVFCIVNSGFFEGKQNAIAIEILKNWCHKMKLQWGMGIGVGGGGSLFQMQSAPLGTGPKKSLGNAYTLLKHCLEDQTSGEDLYISVNLPKWIYKLGAEAGWKQMIKKNGGRAKDLWYRY
ncbi:MAG TPA: hypothetical protein VJY54_07345 [Lachnospiraceae bacterium]|nr:hypothetical protein [Lachnospiraceae bacterium]